MDKQIKCEICGQAKVPAGICGSCARLILDAKSNPEILRKVIKYLEKLKCEICGSTDNQPCWRIVIPKFSLKVRDVFCSKCENILYHSGDNDVGIERFIKVADYLRKILK